MRLIITRHGETEENISGVIQGHLPGKLTDEGIIQARKLALRLKDEKIDFIYSSDLTRASDTAKEIAKYHPRVPIKFVKDLREKFLGEWQGRSKKSLGFTSDTSLVNFSPKDGETNKEMFDRAGTFLHKILLKHRNSNVLFVAHNGINKAMIAVITKKDSESIKAMENHYNTSVSVFEIDEDRKHKILCFNCAKHLKVDFK
jgi:broad specificity phosphatase PhoE